MPDDGGSPWYLPSMDELDLVYRAFKPTTTSNAAGSDGRSVAYRQMSAALQPDGRNASLSTPSAGHTASVPAQTTVAAFQSGGAQALDHTAAFYWSSSSNTYSGYTFWCQSFANGAQENFGAQGGQVRAVRRIALYEPY